MIDISELKTLKYESKRKSSANIHLHKKATVRSNFHWTIAKKIKKIIVAAMLFHCAVAMNFLIFMILGCFFL